MQNDEMREWDAGKKKKKMSCLTLCGPWRELGEGLWMLFDYWLFLLHLVSCLLGEDVNNDWDVTTLFSTMRTSVPLCPWALFNLLNLYAWLQRFRYVVKFKMSPFFCSGLFCIRFIWFSPLVSKDTKYFFRGQLFLFCFRHCFIVLVVLHFNAQASNMPKVDHSTFLKLKN